MNSKISDKDKKDWENFLSNNESLPNKDIIKTKEKLKTLSFDLHGYSLDEANKKINKILNVTVDFIAEVITCIRDKDKKIISGDPDKIKKIYDTWIFSRDVTSVNPNWQLVNTLT